MNNDFAVSPLSVTLEDRLVSATDANDVRLFAIMGLPDDAHGDYGNWSEWHSGLKLTPEQVAEIGQAVEIEDARQRVKLLDHYKVYACAVTGEWLGEPEATGERFTEREWFAKEDTDEEQFDCYDAELFEDDENGMPVPHLETRAITRRWVFSEDQQLEKKIEDARQRVGAWKARREGNIDDPIASAVYALDDRYPGGWGMAAFKECLAMIEEGVDPALAADEV